MVERLKQNLTATQEDSFEVWFIDDGSADDTLAKVKSHNKTDNRFKCVSFSRNFGHHNAIAAGIDKANGDTIVLMDGDLQDRPESIPVLLNKLNEGYDIVCARRSVKRGSKLKQVTSGMFWKFIRVTSGLDLIPDQSIMRAFTKPVLNSLREITESNRFYSALFNWVGFKQIGVQVQYDDRFSGTTKYSLAKLLKLAADATFGFGKAPLWLLIFCGAFFTFVGLTGLFPALNIANPALLLGVVFFACGITAYQIRQALRDSKERPLYIIKEIVE